MQIFFLPDWLMILTFVLGSPILQVTVTVIGNRFADDKFDVNSFWFKTRKWEDNGNFYKRIFKIHLWKHLLPDGAKANKKNGFQKKKLKTLDEEYLSAFIKETCRAEMLHWLQIPPFIIFGLWSPPFVVTIMMGYALLVNIPCILAQRYNRPRILALYREVSERKVSDNK